MAPNDSAPTTDQARPFEGARRKAARYFVPVAVAGVAAATIGLVPALAASGDPDLPKISAQELIEKIAASETQHLSGTVRIGTDLGIPDFSGIADSFLPEGGSEGGSAGSSADPKSKLTQLATGSHTLRVAVDGPERQKLSVLEKDAEYSLIHNGGELWAYDSASNEVFHEKSAEGAKGSERGDGAAKELSTTPAELAEQALKAVGDSTSVTVDGTAQVAGRDAYQLAVKPKGSGSTIGAITIAVDAKTGVPLRFAVNPSSGGKAAVDVSFTKVDFSRPSASTFDFTPPKGAKVTEADELEKQHSLKDDEVKELEKLAGGFTGGGGLEILGKDWTSVAKFGGPSGSDSDKGDDAAAGAAGAAGALGMLGEQVKGDFGSGTVFSTRLVNALLTDDGSVYVGAVTQDALVKAANADN